MGVTISQPNNIETISGNSLAIFKDASSGKFFAKDIKGAIENISDAIGVPQTLQQVLDAGNTAISDIYIEGKINFGEGNNVTGANSLAFGVEAIVNGINSFAGGSTTQASGNQSFAIGFQTLANGVNSFAGGNTTQASGNQSFAFGRTNLASGNNSFAGGNTNQAIGQESFVIGRQTLASGNNSVAGGNNSQASGDDSFSLGHGCISSGNDSFTIGFTTVASGLRSFSSGSQTSAVERNAFATGNLNNANNINSSVFGTENDTNSSHQMVIGKHSDNTVRVGTSVFRIGTGANANNRSNGFVVGTNGEIDMPLLASSTSYADDTQASSGGVEIGQLYRNGSVVQIRVV